MSQPVPRFDHSLRIRSKKDSPLPLLIPGYKVPLNNPSIHINILNLTFEQKCQYTTPSKPPYLYELYPIVPNNIKLIKIDPGLWDEEKESDTAWFEYWKGALNGYGHFQSFRMYKMYEQVSVNCLNNLLIPFIHVPTFRNVVSMSITLGKNSLVYYYVIAACIQYYMCARNRWMSLNLESSRLPDKSKPTFVFMCFPYADFHVDSSTKKKIDISTLNASTLEEHAKNLPLSLFIQEILLVVSSSYPGLFSHEDVVTFCTNKLYKNYMQTLTIMRFRSIIPNNLSDVLDTSLRSKSIETETTISKFYAHPKGINMIKVDVPNKVLNRRVPLYFTHLFMSPYLPILKMDYTLKQSVQSLLPYHPLNRLESDIEPIFREFIESDKQASDQLYSTLNVEIPLFKQHYCFYVRDELAFRYVPPLFRIKAPINSKQTDMILSSWVNQFGGVDSNIPNEPILYEEGVSLEHLFKPANMLSSVDALITIMQAQYHKPSLIKELEEYISIFETEPEVVTLPTYEQQEMIKHICFQISNSNPILSTKLYSLMSLDGFNISQKIHQLIDYDIKSYGYIRKDTFVYMERSLQGPTPEQTRSEIVSLFTHNDVYLHPKFPNWFQLDADTNRLFELMYIESVTFRSCIKENEQANKPKNRISISSSSPSAMQD